MWQYPSDPPYVDIIGSKGLDEKRQNHLSAALHEKTRELTSCLMLVALCEVYSWIFLEQIYKKNIFPVLCYDLWVIDFLFNLWIIYISVAL